MVVRQCFATYGLTFATIAVLVAGPMVFVASAQPGHGAAGKDSGDKGGDKAEKGDKPGKGDRADRAEKGDNKPGKGDRADKAEKGDKPGKADRADKVEGKGPATSGQVRGQSREGGQASPRENAQVNISHEQRTRVTTIIRERHVRPVTNVNFSISVGTIVPTEVVLVPLPVEVVQIVPDFRGFFFFLVGSQIVIVHPHTHQIATVIAIS